MTKFEDGTDLDGDADALLSLSHDYAHRAVQALRDELQAAQERCTQLEAVNQALKDEIDELRQKHHQENLALELKTAAVVEQRERMITSLVDERNSALARYDSLRDSLEQERRALHEDRLRLNEQRARFLDETRMSLQRLQGISGAMEENGAPSTPVQSSSRPNSARRADSNKPRSLLARMAPTGRSRRVISDSSDEEALPSEVDSDAYISENSPKKRKIR
ncbi:hypothetical protein R3P38DRAFT_2882623 [Favolaschia claudopus]|uniref:Uncharacterized protein n=1 Tax=Favolaschia claudopus TaxID=2862362 RepID=A0AAW0D1H8_9AGAR